jgi:hypothetical protein
MWNQDATFTTNLEKNRMYKFRCHSRMHSRFYMYIIKAFTKRDSLTGPAEVCSKLFLIRFFILTRVLHINFIKAVKPKNIYIF